MSMFKKATREQGKARVALLGPSGSGKTYTALLIAKHLGERVAVIDTERGSAAKYAGDVAEFDVCELEDDQSPKSYRRAIEGAAEAGYDVLVIDSLSHAWSGRGGALEMVDNAAKASRSGNSFTAWRDVTPEHLRLVDAVLAFPGHVICTLRVKTAYELVEDGRGKKAPQKIGLEPIQRAGVEYEFDVVGDLDLQHNLVISKTRCPALDGKVVAEPGKDVADALLAWLGKGVDPIAAFVQRFDTAETLEELHAASDDAAEHVRHRSATAAERTRLRRALDAAEDRLRPAEGDGAEEVA